MERRSPGGPAALGADRVDEAGLGRRGLAEFLGTFALTFVAAGGEVIDAASHGAVGAGARVIAPGLVVAALIYSIGDVSGAHFNPVVTLAFSLRRVFPLRYLPLYWAAQVGGACAAAAALRALFGLTGDVGGTQPRLGTGRGFIMEMILTALLVFVIVSTATRHSLVGNDTALAVGGTIALCGLFGAPVSGASMNPARSLGPALVSGITAHLWVYVAGPVIGAALALLLASALHPHRTKGEYAAAQGDG